MRCIFVALIFVTISQFAFAQQDSLKTEQSTEIKYDKQGRRIFDDVKERKGVKYRFIPLPSYEPTTKWGANIINLLTYYPSKGDLVSPPSSSAVFLNASNNGSYIIGLNQRLYLKQDTWRLSAMFMYGKINQNMNLYVDPENDETTLESAKVSSYMSIVSILAQRKIVEHFFLGLGYAYNGRRMEGRNDRASELLGINGYPTDVVRMHGIKYNASYDTRDNINYPYQGFWAKLTVDQNLGTNSATIAVADYRHFFTLWDNVSNVLALHGITRFISKDAPRNFWSNYGRVGGAVQRGYEAGKYVDRNLFSLEAEYRKETPWLNHKLGFVGALGMGKVFGDTHDENNYSKSFGDANWLPTFAVGARYRVMAYERLNVKVDYAVGKDGGVIYFGLTESF